MEIGAGRGGELQQVFCCRTRGETGKLTWRSRCRGEDLKLAYLFPCSLCPVGSNGLSSGGERLDKLTSGGREVGRGRSMGSTKNDVGEVCQGYSVADLGKD